MAYQLNPDGSACWHCDSAWQAAQKAAEDSAKWAATDVQVSSFWKMTHSTLFWFVVIAIVGLFFLARWHTSSR